RDNSFWPCPMRKEIRLRPAAYAEKDRVFSITIGTSPRAPIFQDLEFGRLCVLALKDLRDRTSTGVYAYCFMPDHVHLLLGIPAGTPLTAFVRSFKSLCYRIRRQRGQPVPFWQRSFYDQALREPDRLLDAALYILNNPVRDGITSSAGDYE